MFTNGSIRSKAIARQAPGSHLSRKAMKKATKIGPRILLACILLAGCHFMGNHPDRKQIPFPRLDVWIDISRDNDTVVFSSPSGQLNLYSLKTRQKTKLPSSPTWRSFPHFSPDGRSIAYVQGASREQQGNIFLCPVDGKNIRQLTDSPDYSDMVPGFSPDGSQIVFVRCHRQRDYAFGGKTWDDQDVCLMNRDGSNLRRLTTGHFYSLYRPVFLNQNTILFSDCGPGKDSIYAVPVTGGNYYTWLTPPHTPAEINVGDIDVSPDGSRVLFIADCQQSFFYDINIVDLKNKTSHPLGVTTMTTYNTSPVFANDRKSICYLGVDGNSPDGKGTPSLWRVDIAMKKTTKIASAEIFER